MCIIDFKSEDFLKCFGIISVTVWGGVNQDLTSQAGGFAKQSLALTPNLLDFAFGVFISCREQSGVIDILSLHCAEVAVSSLDVLDGANIAM